MVSRSDQIELKLISLLDFALPSLLRGSVALAVEQEAAGDRSPVVALPIRLPVHQMDVLFPVQLAIGAASQ